MDFYVASGVCQSTLVLGCIARYSRDALTQPFVAIKTPAAVLSGALSAVLVFLEIVAINRGEVDRLWIFLAAFQSILVGHACTWRASNATFHMVVVSSLLQSALTNSLVMFAAPGEYSHRCWGGSGLKCNEDLKQPSSFS